MAADLDFFSPQNIKSKNDKAIRNLSQSIKRVIPFVGAGISKACGLPKWDELLDQLALNHFSPSNRKKINKNDVFSYADSIYSI